jgi:hypothetical protein
MHGRDKNCVHILAGKQVKSQILETYVQIKVDNALGHGEV